MMTVKELLKELEDTDPETEVILQKDGEGNGYSPLAGVDIDTVYIPDSTWSGDIYPMEWSCEEACMDEDEWDEIKDRTKCVLLYPVN